MLTYIILIPEVISCLSNFHLFSANFCPHKDEDDCPSTCYNYQNDQFHSQIDTGVPNKRKDCLLACPGCGAGWPPCELNLYKDMVIERNCDEDVDNSVCFHKVRYLEYINFLVLYVLIKSHIFSDIY